MNFNDAFSIVPRSIISLVVLFIITKLIGKKQVSELSLFDYVIGISIGNFTAEMTMDLDGQYINGVIAIVTFGVFAFLVNLISMKSIIFRRLIFGVPTIIISNGEILIEQMRKCKIDINDLLEQARNAGYFDISEIAYAIMEANGKLSFLLKDPNTPFVKKDLNVTINPDSLSSNIIIDSKLMLKNIKSTNHDLKWFRQQLSVLGYKDYSNILLCTYKNEKINVFRKNKGRKEESSLE